MGLIFHVGSEKIRVPDGTYFFPIFFLMFLSTRIFLGKNTQDELASNADILWARHAVFLPHECLLKPRKHSLPFVFSRPDHGCGFCPNDRQENT